MENILANVPGAILQKPVPLTVELKLKPWQKWIRKIRRQPMHRELILKPCSLGTLVKVSNDLLGIHPDILKDPNFLRANYIALQQHGKTLAKVIAEYITNDEKPAPEDLVKFILFHFTPAEILSATAIIMKQMNVEAFSISITLIGSLNVISPDPANVTNAKPDGVNPSDQVSSIASGPLSVAL